MIETKNPKSLICLVDLITTIFILIVSKDQTKCVSREVWERHIASFILNINSRLVFFDIGANIGFHSTFLEKLSKKENTIIAVEPHPDILHVLKKNRTQNSCKFHIVEAACWDAPGYVYMNSVLAKDTGDTFITSGDVKIPTVTIDDLADNFGHPNIIKMDIQGFEADAILGARKTIQRGGLNFLIEFHPKLAKRSSKDLISAISLFENYGYKPYFFRAHPWHAVAELDYDILKSIYKIWHENDLSGMDLVFSQSVRRKNP